MCEGRLDKGLAPRERDVQRLWEAVRRESRLPLAELALASCGVERHWTSSVER